MITPTAQEWVDRARNCIAQGALTNSKRAATFVEGVYPQHLSGADGAYVYDVEGVKYADFICGLGANLFGYSNPDLDHGQGAWRATPAWSLSTCFEVVLAERLKMMLPFIDRLKFLKSGTEACNAAIRIARAWNGRDLVLSDGYHGWGDDFIALDVPAAGIPPGVKAAISRLGPCHDTTEFPNLTEKVAAVIVEPVLCEASDERRRYLEKLAVKCRKVGAVLIFDEIITGFRFPKYCVANYWGVKPDLICLGKAIAGGHPLSVVAGRKELMDNPAYFVSSTFAGEVGAILAANRACELLQTSPNYSLSSLWEAGADWIARFNRIWPPMLQLEAYPTRGAFKAVSDQFKALFWQEACKAGMLFGPSWFFNFALAKLDRDIQLKSIEEILCKIKTGAVRLEGKMPVPPKAQMMRQAAR